jgi:V/A-type H+/Na+-transporting ATPase subunit D
MAKLALSKSGLQKEKQQLKLYKRLLPSLDLKRMQLTAEHARAKTEMENLQRQTETTMAEACEQLPMLANEDVDLTGLVKIDRFECGEESIVGVRIPILREIVFSVPDYSMLAKPHWVDAYIAQMKKVVELKIRLSLMGQRVERLGRAVRRITQHVNLFEKILIPAAKKNIQKIQIVLGDAERSAVVRSKLAKSLHAKQRKEMLEA